MHRYLGCSEIDARRYVVVAANHGFMLAGEDLGVQKDLTLLQLGIKKAAGHAQSLAYGYGVL